MEDVVPPSAPLAHEQSSTEKGAGLATSPPSVGAVGTGGVSDGDDDDDTEIILMEEGDFSAGVGVGSVAAAVVGGGDSEAAAPAVTAVTAPAPAAPPLASEPPIAVVLDVGLTPTSYSATGSQLFGSAVAVTAGSGSGSGAGAGGGAGAGATAALASVPANSPSGPTRYSLVNPDGSENVVVDTPWELRVRKKVDYNAVLASAGSAADSTAHPSAPSTGLPTGLEFAENTYAHDVTVWRDRVGSRVGGPGNHAELTADQLTLDWIVSTGFRQPALVKSPEGLGISLPPDLSVAEVARVIGPSFRVGVIDVVAQSELPRQVPLGVFADYMSNPGSRHKVLNLISLEFSETPLAKYVVRPEVVRKLDWIDSYWPKDRRRKLKEYPQVQLYCLISCESSFTDFHADFGGTSVWYHVVHGEKVFFMVPPTEDNVRKYEKWQVSSSTAFFGDSVSGLYVVRLLPGNTFFIPAGWIHAVYTPVDSMVFGGNFLHGLDIGMQIRIVQAEQLANTAQKFVVPYMTQMWIYAAGAYLEAARQPQFTAAVKAIAAGAPLPAGPWQPGCSRWEQEGLPLLVAHLHAIMDGATQVKDGSYSHHEVGEEVARQTRCTSFREVLDELLGRLKGTFVPRRPTIKVVVKAPQATAGTIRISQPHGREEAQHVHASAPSAPHRIKLHLGGGGGGGGGSGAPAPVGDSGVAAAGPGVSRGGGVEVQAAAVAMKSNKLKLSLSVPGSSAPPAAPPAHASALPSPPEPVLRSTPAPAPAPAVKRPPPARHRDDDDDDFQDEDSPSESEDEGADVLATVTKRVEDVSQFGRKRSRLAIEEAGDDGDDDYDDDDDGVWVPGGSKQRVSSGKKREKKKKVDPAAEEEKARRRAEKEEQRRQKEEAARLKKQKAAKPALTGVALLKANLKKKMALLK